MKRKAVSVTVVTITKYTIIALFVLWELFGVVFGLHPELGSLPYLGELNTYYKEENGIHDYLLDKYFMGNHISRNLHNALFDNSDVYCACITNRNG